MALTDIAVKKAKGKDKPYKLGDAGGMYLWVTPTGGRSWRWTYRFDRKQKVMTLPPLLPNEMTECLDSAENRQSPPRFASIEGFESSLREHPLSY